MDAGELGCAGSWLGAYMANTAPTRRLTTTVAADVAGYSRLTAADEEGTLGALRAHRAELIDPKIAEYEGRIANTAGHSLLIEFASVVNAPRAALEIQADVTACNADVPPERRIEFRVGINVGDVVAEGADLLGDGVNVAARPDHFAHALPDRSSIAIMPFANLSNDPQQEYFADGFTEDLITNVAQSKDLFVIARNSTFTYKGRASARPILPRHRKSAPRIFRLMIMCSARGRNSL